MMFIPAEISAEIHSPPRPGAARTAENLARLTHHDGGDQHGPSGPQRRGGQTGAFDSRKLIALSRDFERFQKRMDNLAKHINQAQEDVRSAQILAKNHLALQQN